MRLLRINLLFAIVLLLVSGCVDKFDKKEWLENNNDNPDNPRFDMTEDLTKNYLKVGKTRKDEVINLLGLPDSESELNGYTTLEFSIGSNPGFHIDPFYLELEFNRKDVLSRADIIEH